MQQLRDVRQLIKYQLDRTAAGPLRLSGYRSRRCAPRHCAGAPFPLATPGPQEGKRRTFFWHFFGALAARHPVRKAVKSISGLFGLGCGL
jgi:hypothetical protein